MIPIKGIVLIYDCINIDDMMMNIHVSLVNPSLIDEIDIMWVFTMRVKLRIYRLIF